MLPAGASAAHAAGVGFGTVIGGHISAIIGVGPVTIQSRISASVAGEVQRPAIDGKIPVRVQTVPIRYDGDGSSIYGDKAVLADSKLVASAAEAGAVCAAGGVEAVIMGGNIKGPPLHGDGQTLNALIAVGDGELPALDGHCVIGVDGIVSTGQGKRPIGDSQRSSAMDAVISAVHCKYTAIDHQHTVGFHPLLTDRIGCGCCFCACRFRFLIFLDRLSRRFCCLGVRWIARLLGRFFLRIWPSLLRPIPRWSTPTARCKFIFRRHSDGSAAFSCCQFKIATVHLQSSTGTNGVSLGVDRIGPILNIQEPFGCIICIFGVKAVLFCCDLECASSNRKTILAYQTMLCGSDRVAAICNRQFILRHHSVTSLSIDRKAAGTIKSKVSLGKDHAINVILIYGSVCTTICEGVVRSLFQGNKHLVCVQRIDGCRISACNIRTRQDDLHLVCVISIHQDLSIIQCTGNEVCTLIKQGNTRPVDRNCVRVTGNRVSCQFNAYSSAFIIIAAQITLTEQGCDIDDFYFFRIGRRGCVRIGIPVLCSSLAATEQKQASQQ